MLFLIIKSILTKPIYQIANYIKQAYSLDLRALGLMRIAISLVLLGDLVIRSLSIKAFFTDEGVLPIQVLKDYNWNPFYFSFHALSGNLWWQIILFVINAACIIALLIGYRYRLFTLICWVFLTSLQNRNPFILQGGDDLIRLLLFWAIFLPWGERYSIQKQSNYSNTYYSFANVGYIFLIASVYFFSALLKTSPEWHEEGTAMYFALSLDQIRLPLGTLIYQFPNLMKALTWIVYHIELLAPFFLIIPVRYYQFRLIGITLITLLHIGIGGSLYVGLFFVFGLTSLIGMLPEKIMNCYVEKKWPEKTIIINSNQNDFPLIYEFFTAFKNFYLGLVFAFCLMLNLSNVQKFPFTIDISFIQFGNIFRLEQNWGMFAPYILKDDGFLVFSAYTTKNEYIDIRREGKKLSFDKPKSLVTEFESDRWRKFTENYLYNNNNYMRMYYCNYLFKKWNTEHPEQKISDLTIFFVKETSLPNYQTKPLEKSALCNCQDNE
jgi:hypothetical protein